jgi:NADH:ubiquinone oxidoreductase subunit E
MEATVMLENIDLEDIDSLIEKYGSKHSALIAILQEIQDKYRYLPKKSLLLVSEMLGLPISQTLSVATFYHAFSLEPKGEHQISLCLGTACHVKGAERILEKFARELGMESPGTSKDLQFTLEPVRCLGCCSLAPVARIDDDTYGRLTQEKIPKILQKYKKA